MRRPAAIDYAHRAVVGATLLALTLPSTACDRLESTFRRDDRPDVVLVVIDTLRPDHLSTYGYERETDRALSTIARTSVVFDNAFASAPKTIPSIPQTLSSSLFPDAVRGKTLMEVARDAGYEESLAVINNPYVKKWVERLDPTFATVSAGEFSATQIVDQALEWFERPRNGPRLVYLHFLDTHTPYDVPLPFKSMFVNSGYDGAVGLEFDDVGGACSGHYAKEDQERIVDLYDGTIAYVDDEFGRLIGGMQDLDLVDDALIVVTSDHGEEFWDHGSFFHGQSLYDELLRVPLLVKFPGNRQASRRVETPASMLDILPTIAAAMAGKNDPALVDQSWQGTRLENVIAGEAGTADRALVSTVGRADHRRPPRHAVRTATHKLIVNVVDGTRELYELATDPAERRSVIAMGQHPPRALLDAYATAMAPLAQAGYQLEITNATDSKVSYDLELHSDPPSPIANLHRIELEKTDIAAITANAAGLRWTGRLGAGETDRMRFDLLARDGDITVALAIDGHLADAGAFSIGADGIPADANPARVSIADIDGPPSIASSARTAIRALLPTDGAADRVTLAIWRDGGLDTVLPPALTSEESARIRALGYME